MTEDFIKEALPHLAVLNNYANKITGNSQDAEDLLQDTYLRAYRFFHKYEKGTNCRAWLFRIMRNLFLNDCKKAKGMPGITDYFEVENFIESAKSEYTESIDLQERMFSNLLDDDVTQALNSLKDDFKTVIILSDLEGLSYVEISEFTGSPVGTVRSRLHRARRILGRKLSRYAQNKGFVVERKYMTA